jgi:predicted nucleic acid-binding protein
MAKNDSGITDSIPLIICDAGPLIHLDEIGCLELLTDFDKVLVPGQVWQEVQHHRPTALANHVLKLQQVVVAIDPSFTFQRLVHKFTLDLGEQAALSLMANHPTALLLTDDTAARQAAQTLNYAAYGTLGVLLRAIRRSQKTTMDVIQILQTLPEKSTLHVRRSFLQSVIAEVVNSVPTRGQKQ